MHVLSLPAVSEFRASGPTWSAPMSKEILFAQSLAGSQLLDVMHALQRSGRNVLTELLAPAVSMNSWDHYPEREVFDQQTGYRYYYHAHPNPSAKGEHGHFHLFARVDGGDGEPAFTHLLAIGMTATGFPRRAFTTNRWVTGEQWRPAAEVTHLLGRFQIQRPRRLRLVHRWLEALLHLFQPQLGLLVRQRDARCAALLEARPGLFEDRRTTLFSQCRLDLVRQFALLDRRTPAIH